jgi:hypothetical protein
MEKAGARTEPWPVRLSACEMRLLSLIVFALAGMACERRTPPWLEQMAATIRRELAAVNPADGIDKTEATTIVFVNSRTGAVWADGLRRFADFATFRTVVVQDFVRRRM